MKKTILSTLAAMFVAAIASAQTTTQPQADLKTSLDTLSYELGVAQSQGLRQFAAAQLGIDTTYIEEFYKGIASINSSNQDPKMSAYVAGIQIGQQIMQQIYVGANKDLFGSDTTRTINLGLLVAGIIDGDKGQARIPAAIAGSELGQRINDIKAQHLAEAYGDNKVKSEAYIADKAKEKDINKLPGGTLYKVLAQGNGPKPEANNTIKVVYEGRLIDGTTFDSSDGEPVDIPLSQLIPSWKEALVLMPEGSEWELYVPYDQAYNDRDMGVIKPYSALVFYIKLVSANATPQVPETITLPDTQATNQQ